MDPLSITASCLACLSAIIGSSKCLLVSCKRLGNASAEILTVAQEVQSFDLVLKSLQQQLQGFGDSQCDADIACILLGIRLPLENCKRHIDKLSATLDTRQFHAIRSLNRLSNNIKWAFSSRNEVNELLNLLEASKSTLQLVLTQLTIYSLNTTIHQQTTSSTGQDGNGRSRTTVLNDCEILDGMKHTSLPIEKPLQILPPLLQRDLEQFKCQVLDEVRTAIINSASVTVTTQRRICQALADHSERLNKVEASYRISKRDSASMIGISTEVLSTCASKCAKEGNEKAVQSLSKSFSGSATYAFERGCSFYPERYSSETYIKDRLFLAAATETRTPMHSIELFIYYRCTPRHWQRIHLCVDVEDHGETAWTLLPATQILENNNQWETPSPQTQKLFEPLLEKIKFFEPVTNLHLTLLRNTDGSVMVDDTTLQVQKDYQEAALSGEQQALSRLRDLHCAQFRESDLVTVHKGFANTFVVFDGRNEYLEHKVRFVHAAQRNENGYRVFIEQIMKIVNLSKCPGVIRFSGLVLDDDQTHVKGYLTETVLGELEVLLSYAMHNNRIIPWSLRSLWSTQLIQSIRDIHLKEFIIGRVQPAISQEGNLVLHKFWSSQLLPNGDGRLPPELRSSRSRGGNSERFTQQGDIFQLGLLLWRLSEHRGRSPTHFCMMAKCTTRPYYTCAAEHRNPVLLPFSDATDDHMRTIIQNCRTPDPRKRMTAEEVFSHSSSLFRQNQMNPDLCEQKKALVTFMQGFPEHACGTTYCSECWRICVDDLYHCFNCNDNDFDLCPNCVSQGIWCYDQDHELLRRRLDAIGNALAGPYLGYSDRNEPCLT